MDFFFLFSCLAHNIKQTIWQVLLGEAGGLLKSYAQKLDCGEFTFACCFLMLKQLHKYVEGI